MTTRPSNPPRRCRHGSLSLTGSLNPQRLVCPSWAPGQYGHCVHAKRASTTALEHYCTLPSPPDYVVEEKKS